jgi:hypothetical protein
MGGSANHSTLLQRRCHHILALVSAMLLRLLTGGNASVYEFNIPLQQDDYICGRSGGYMGWISPVCRNSEDRAQEWRTQDC